MYLEEPNFNNIITESANEGKDLYLSGIMLQGVERNRNGRIYPKHLIEGAVQSINESLAKGMDVLGEIDHPPSLEVHLQNASHKITELKMEGDNAVGKIKILDTPAGQIVKSLIKEGIRFGVSSRGSGSVNESSGIVEDYDIVTIDIVATPSAQTAYPTTVYEQLEQYYRHREMFDLAEAVRHDAKAQEYFEKELIKYINELMEK